MWKNITSKLCEWNRKNLVVNTLTHCPLYIKGFQLHLSDISVSTGTYFSVAKSCDMYLVPLWYNGTVAVWHLISMEYQIILPDTLILITIKSICHYMIPLSISKWCHHTYLNKFHSSYAIHWINIHDQKNAVLQWHCERWKGRWYSIIWSCTTFPGFKNFSTHSYQHIRHNTVHRARENPSQKFDISACARFLNEWRDATSHLKAV
jgi:hypothetical protein